MTESAEHLAGRIMREREHVHRYLARRATVTDTGFDYTRNIGELVYQLHGGERFQVQIRAWTEVPDDGT